MSGSKHAAQRVVAANAAFAAAVSAVEKTNARSMADYAVWCEAITELDRSRIEKREAILAAEAESRARGRHAAAREDEE